MSLEVEAIGDMVTAGLVAREVEGDKGGTSGHAHTAPCANCGTPVSGNYCGHCGQKGHLHKSVLHLAEELVHGLLHFDTKGWRTLPLLVGRPGQLTRRYIDGQRTRFVSPLALFLFMMFFMFFVFSLTMGGVGNNINTGAEAKQKSAAAFEAKIENAQERVSDAEQRLKEAEAGSKEAERAQKSLDKARVKLAAAQAAAKAAEQARAAGADAASASAEAAAVKASEGSLSDFVKGSISVDKDEKTKTYSDVPWIDKGIRHAVENPELAMYKLKNAAYKYSFLLVPISMPFLWLMFFWKRGITMYDHAVFSLYSLSFMSLLFTAVATLGYFGFSGWAASLFTFVPPVHMFLHLRGTYQLGRFGAFWRTCALLFMTVLALTCYTLVVLALSAT